MKDYSDTQLITDEYDFDSLSEEMDILFGTMFSALSIVTPHLITNETKYSEVYPYALYLDNNDKVQYVNDRFGMPERKKEPDKIQH